MALLTSTQYQQLLGSLLPAPTGFASAQAVVVASLERALNRQLESGVRTETLTAYSDGVVYPSAVPVTNAGDLETDGRAIYTGQTGRVTVTYTGGFTPFEATTGTPLPADLALAIAYGIRTYLDTKGGSTSTAPTGVQSLTVGGEYSVTYQPGVIVGADGQSMPSTLAELAPFGGACARLAAPYRRP